MKVLFEYTPREEQARVKVDKGRLTGIKQRKGKLADGNLQAQIRVLSSPSLLTLSRTEKVTHWKKGECGQPQEGMLRDFHVGLYRAILVKGQHKA